MTHFHVSFGKDISMAGYSFKQTSATACEKNQQQKTNCGVPFQTSLSKEKREEENNLKGSLSNKHQQNQILKPGYFSLSRICSSKSIRKEVYSGMIHFQISPQQHQKY